MKWSVGIGEARTLENLEVLQICVLGVYVEFHPGHSNVKVDTVEDLTQSRTEYRILAGVNAVGAGHA